MAREAIYFLHVPSYSLRHDCLAWNSHLKGLKCLGCTSWELDLRSLVGTCISDTSGMHHGSSVGTHGLYAQDEYPESSILRAQQQLTPQTPWMNVLGAWQGLGCFECAFRSPVGTHSLGCMSLELDLGSSAGTCSRASQMYISRACLRSLVRNQTSDALDAPPRSSARTYSSKCLKCACQELGLRSSTRTGGLDTSNVCPKSSILSAWQRLVARRSWMRIPEAQSGILHLYSGYIAKVDWPVLPHQLRSILSYINHYYYYHHYHYLL